MDEGNIIRSGDSNGIVVLTQLRPISVIFTLPEQTLGEIQKELSQGELKVLAVDRHTVVVVDLTEALAGKSALQEAAAVIAERLLPKLLKEEKKP